MKTLVFFIGFLILGVSAGAYLKWEEPVCKKSCCLPVEKSATKNHNSCCGTVCSPFMKCQSSFFSVNTAFLQTEQVFLNLEHHSALPAFYLIAFTGEHWHPPKV